MLSLNEEVDKAIHSPSYQLPRSSSNLEIALADADSHKSHIDTSDDGNGISNSNNIRPPASTSSSLLDGMNSGIPVEITPPPLLHRSSDEQLLPTNPLSAFPSRFNNNDNDTNGNSGGTINVDNIFNAIIDDTPPQTGHSSIDNSIGNNYTSNNSIFHNFSSSGNNNGNSGTSSAAPLSILVPPKKSSIHVDNNINYNMINAYTPSPVNPTQQQQQKQPILSKSMNTASFIRPIITHAESGDQYEHYTTNHRNNSILRRHSGHHRPIYASNSGSAADTTGAEGGRTRSGSIEYNTGVDQRSHSGIDVPRYAGYLLKRSNNPYVDTSVQPSVQIVNAVLPQPVKELHLDSSDGGNGIEQLYHTLPFGGGVDSSHSAEENVLNSMGYLDSNEYYDETSIDDDNSEEKDQCFCAPLLQLLTGRKRHRKKENIMSPPKMNYSDFGSPVIDYPEEYQKQLLLLNDVVVSQIPLKEPARSDPVPIGGERQPPFIESQMATNRKIMGGLVPRSSSNVGSGLNISSSSNRLKDYPPPPPDYIDPRDGHIWRAKYCVLEEGILYFYRNAMEGESDEAQTERNESLNYHAAVTTTSATAANSSLGLSSSPSLSGIPIPIDSMTREAAPTIATVESSSAKLRKKDMFDLSKSPMPMKKSDFFQFRMPTPSSNQSGSKAPISATVNVPNKTTTSTPAFRQSPKVLHHSTSTSTFHHDSDILWEKRVALDCVGAVRSSVQEHGDHAFELLAYGGTDDGEQSNEHEIIDKLILRAENSDDMNTWMFQFHLSLASYMQRIVSSALNNRHNGTSTMRVRPDSPSHQVSQHRRIGTPVGISTNKHNPLQSSSPIGGSSFGSGYSPGAGPSLSHGHGRNALYRRKLRDDTSSPTPGGGSPESSISTLIERSESVDSKKRAVAVLGLRDVRKSTEGPSPSPKSAAATTPAAAPPRKYVPPHLRQNNATPGKKYIPPHLRRKMENAKNGATGAELAPSVIKQIPLNDTINNSVDDIKESNFKSQTRDDDGAESDTPSDSALSTTSSLLSRQLDDVSDVDMRRGGCADPSVILGSILDDIFIPRGASVVKSVRLEPYGCTGGGFFTSTRYDKVRGISIPFDDDVSNSENCNILSGLKWEVGASSECGIRNSNEDSYVVINNLDEVISSQGLTSFAEQDVGQTKQQGLFAIFDGHVGNQAARFAAEKFPEMLMEEQSALASRDSATISSIEDRTLEVLRNTFARLDKEFCSLCTKGGRNWDCGSTALAALVVDDVLTLANLGDCRGVVCRVVSSGIVESADADWHELDVDVDGDMPWDRSNRAFSPDKRLFWREITETHSPLLPEEEERIKAANGWIIDETEIPTGQIHRMDFFDEDVVDIVKRCFADRLGQHRSDPARSIRIARTCGDLAVSRAIGDRDFKAAYNSPNDVKTLSEDRTNLAVSWEGPQVFLYPTGHNRRFKGDLVSSIPDVKFLKIGQEDVLDEFLLMACDGLWDVMDGDDAVRIAKNLLFDKKLSAKDGAERLAELAKHLGSSDNITVILIRFYWEQIDNK